MVIRRRHALISLVTSLLVTSGVFTGIGAVTAGPASAAPQITSASASASGSFEYCIGYECLNSWNGGPWVDVYTGGPDGTPNNYFTVFCDTATGNCFIEDTGGNSWDGKCIGDAYNESGQAATSLDGCGNGSGNGGWGTNFKLITTGCPFATAAFYNVHWKGYLGPPSGAVNGSHFYLNNPRETCFATAS
jgi:hypothetical protein